MPMTDQSSATIKNRVVFLDPSIVLFPLITDIWAYAFLCFHPIYILPTSSIGGSNDVRSDNDNFL